MAEFTSGRVITREHPPNSFLYTLTHERKEGKLLSLEVPSSPCLLPMSKLSVQSAYFHFPHLLPVAERGLMSLGFPGS